MPRWKGRRGSTRASIDDIMMTASVQQQILLNQQHAQLMQLIEELQMQRLIHRLLIENLRQREDRALEIFNILEAHRDEIDNGPRPEWHPAHNLHSNFHGSDGSSSSPPPPPPPTPPRLGDRGHEPPQARAIEEDVPRRGADAGGDAGPPGTDEPAAQSAGRRGSFERLRPNPFDI
jgi:hypothetical protein